MRRRLQTGLTALSFSLLSSSVIAAGSGYPEYEVVFEKPFYYDTGSVSAGTYNAVIVTPTVFQRSHRLYILENIPREPSDVERLAVAEFPLLCSLSRSPVTRSHKQRVIMDDDHFIAFFRFEDHSDGIDVVSCVAVIEASM